MFPLKIKFGPLINFDDCSKLGGGCLRGVNEPDILRGPLEDL
jgi:hypothetical protein